MPDTDDLEALGQHIASLQPQAVQNTQVLLGELTVFC